MITNKSELSQREYEQMQHQKEMLEIQTLHTQKIKAIEYEVVKLESKWASWLRIPITIVKLPILFVASVAFIVYAIRGTEPPENLISIFK